MSLLVGSLLGTLNSSGLLRLELVVEEEESLLAGGRKRREGTEAEVSDASGRERERDASTEEENVLGLGASNDGEHPLSGLVMGNLGDGDLGSRKSSDLGDLGSSSTAEGKRRTRRETKPKGQLSFLPRFVKTLEREEAAHMMQPTMSEGIEMF